MASWLRSWAFLFVTVGFAGCQTGPVEVSTSEGLREALADARSGDTVSLVAGRFEGSFSVPAGVTVRGTGAMTVIVSADGHALAVSTSASEEVSVVESLAVESSGTVGVVAGGTGGARIEDVTITATRGIAVGAEGLASLEIRRTALRGPVTPENAESTDLLEPSSDTTATHGLVAVEVTSLAVEDVEVSGFALYGALTVDSGAAWVRGQFTKNLGSGLTAAGGTTELTESSVSTTLRGLRAWPVYGFAFVGGDVEIVSGNANDNEGIGVAFFDATGAANALNVARNSNGGAWLQDSPGFGIEASSFDENSFLGLASVRSDGLTLRTTSIERTVLARRAFAFDPVDIGDGLHLIESTDVELLDVRFAANERAGALIDLADGDTSGLTIEGVTASASDSALGLVVQSGTVAPGWDDGVTREGAAEVNDSAFIEAGVPLDVVSIVTPTDIPSSDGIRSSGLSIFGIVTPTD